MMWCELKTPRNTTIYFHPASRLASIFGHDAASAGIANITCSGETLHILHARQQRLVDVATSHHHQDRCRGIVGEDDVLDVAKHNFYSESIQERYFDEPSSHRVKLVGQTDGVSEISTSEPTCFCDYTSCWSRVTSHLLNNTT